MSDDNRIGAACWYFRRKYVSGYFVATEWFGGRLRNWSTDHEEYIESSPGHFPVAVVEDDKSGRVYSIPVTQVCFSAKPPDAT